MNSSPCILSCLSASVGVIFVKVVRTTVYLFHCMEFHCMNLFYPCHFNDHMACA